jgi:hypothetical protein
MRIAIKNTIFWNRENTSQLKKVVHGHPFVPSCCRRFARTPHLIRCQKIECESSPTHGRSHPPLVTLQASLGMGKGPYTYVHVHTEINSLIQNYMTEMEELIQ